MMTRAARLFPPGSIAWQLANQGAAALYSAACTALFALALLRLRAARSAGPAAGGARARVAARLWRACCMWLVAALVAGQPLIYRNTGQPACIGIAAMCMLTAWSLLGMLLLPAAQAPASVPAVFLACAMHPLQGVRQVHARRMRGAARHAAARGAAVGAKGAPCAAARARPVIHVDGAREACDGLAAAATAAVAAEPALLPALWTLCRLTAAYDLGSAALCCGAVSGCLCGGGGGGGGGGAARAWQRPEWGLLGRVLGPLAHHAWSFAAGALLPLQMGILYAATRLALIAAGRAARRMARAPRTGPAAAPKLASGGAALLELAGQLPSEAFDAPLASASLSELWGARWHQFLRFHFQEGLGRGLIGAVTALLPRGARRPGAAAAASTAVAFLLSGLLHEYLTWAAWGDAGGRYLAFFGIHGAAVLAEAAAAAAAPAAAAAAPRWLRRAGTLAFIALASPLFTETYRREGYFDDSRGAWHPLLAPAAAALLRRRGWCGGGGACSA
ncbi:MAG: hypothetical protein J3K34DRAFT_489188 [Monoraphidium minutum]|nr:MAG: hypothetical protein J3K34DRAFT_489188 [Monoraphidium minutum]